MNKAQNEIKIYRISNGYLIMMPDKKEENLFDRTKMLEKLTDFKMNLERDPVLRRLQDPVIEDVLPDEPNIESDNTIIFCPDKAAVSAQLLTLLD